MRNSSTHDSCDVVVVGAGAAGLSGAIALARSLRSVVVIDGGSPRNAVSPHAHNVLGHEGIAPLELLARGRGEAEHYGVRLIDQQASATRPTNGGFEVELVSGEVVEARRMLLATGLTDELPEVPGLRDFWGTSVLHCPYCHGWEVRGQRIGVLCTTPMSLHQALLFRQLSEHITLFVQDIEISEESDAQLSALAIDKLSGTVRGVSGTDGNLCVNLDGTDVEVQALVVAPYFRARADLFVQLGGELTTHAYGSFIETDPTGATSVAGVWAAGNIANVSAMVSSSAGAGVLAGAAINGDLVASDVSALQASQGGASWK